MKSHESCPPTYWQEHGPLLKRTIGRILIIAGLASVAHFGFEALGDECKQGDLNRTFAAISLGDVCKGYDQARQGAHNAVTFVQTGVHEGIDFILPPVDPPPSLPKRPH